MPPAHQPRPRLVATPRHAGAPLLLLVALSLTACNQNEAERCEDLQAQLADREDQLATDCLRDDECLVVEVVPGRLVAARALPHDPVRDAYQRDLRSACNAPQTPKQIFETSCAAIIPETRVGTCALTFDGLVLTPDDAQQLLANYCECDDDDACADGLRCVDCACYTPCQAACQRASLCDNWTDLGLGADLDTCVAVCEHNIRDDDTHNLALCLADAPACADLTACF